MRATEATLAATRAGLRRSSSQNSVTDPVRCRPRPSSQRSKPPSSSPEACSLAMSLLGEGNGLAAAQALDILGGEAVGLQRGRVHHAEVVGHQALGAHLLAL